MIRQVPYGRVTTYGQVARLVGNPRLSRVVGYAMSSCRFDDVPCHRVVNRLGQTAPSFDTQRLRLEMEGVAFTDSGRVPLERFMWYGPGGEKL